MQTQFRLRRKAVEKEARRQDILDAAARLFSSRDFHEVTVDRVAEEVGLSKGTLYLYFKNKDDLFYTILVEKAQSLLRRVEETANCAKPFVECLHDVVRTHCLFYQENVAYFRMIHSEMIRMSAESHHRLHIHLVEGLRAWFEVMAELVKKGQAEGILRQHEPVALIKTLRGILNSYVLYDLLVQSENPLTDHVQEIVDLYLHGAAGRNA